MKLPDFKNEPLSDFKNNPAHRRRMEYALEEIREELGREYDLVIGGERIKTKEKLHSINPSHPDEVVGVFSQADAALADRRCARPTRPSKPGAVLRCRNASNLLLKTSKILLDRKYYYEARLVYEVGKTWPEADADVAEAIDFIEYYARAMGGLMAPQPLTPYPVRSTTCAIFPSGWAS